LILEKYNTRLTFVKWQDVSNCLDEILLWTAIEDVTAVLVDIASGEKDDCVSLPLDSTDCTRLFKLTKVKDRFSSSDCLGYRDICLNLEVRLIIDPLYP
jgi:hypothetical protein